MRGKPAPQTTTPATRVLFADELTTFPPALPGSGSAAHRQRGADTTGGAWLRVVAGGARVSSAPMARWGRTVLRQGAIGPVEPRQRAIGAIAFWFNGPLSQDESWLNGSSGQQAGEPEGRAGPSRTLIRSGLRVYGGRVPGGAPLKRRPGPVPPMQDPAEERGWRSPICAVPVIPAVPRSCICMRRRRAGCQQLFLRIFREIFVALRILASAPLPSAPQPAHRLAKLVARATEGAASVA